jgi:transcriptional regulator with XRE-family HTH domain
MKRSLTSAFNRIKYPRMDYMERIRDIEGRARALKMTVCAVCRQAGVRPHFVSRWRNGTVSPTIRSLNLHLGKLERWLDDAERPPDRIAS